MWKIHRYYLAEVTVSAVMTFLVLFGIVLLSLVARGIERTQGADLSAAAVVVLFFAFDIVPDLLTISLLFGTVLTFARASRDREITAIRTAGISPWVPMVAPLLVGVLLSLAGSYLQHYLIPEAHFRKYRIVAASARNLFMSLNLDGEQIRLMDHGVMMWKDRSPDGHFLDITIFRGGRPGHREGALTDSPVYTAEEAWFEQSGDELTLVMRGLRDPLRTESFVGRLQLSINIRAITEQGRRHEDDRDIPSDQLLSEVYRGVHDSPGAATYAIFHRSCIALMPALFAPIGFCIGVLAKARGQITALTMSIIPLALFYFCDFLVARLLRSTDEPILAWLPAMVIAALGAGSCWKLFRL